MRKFNILSLPAATVLGALAAPLFSPLTLSANDLTASDRASNDRFGESVSLSGTTAVVGARLDDDNGSSSGSAYVFRDLDTASGSITENVKLTASDGASSDWFGWSVNVSGSTAIVGASGDDDGGSDSGAAYVFRDLDTASGSITENVKLTASDGAANDYFGEAVAISGAIAIVGAHREDQGEASTGADLGAAYVFRGLDTASGSITENIKLTASNGNYGDWFGSAVGISGTQAIVGALYHDGNGTNAGSAYVFRDLDTASGSITENVKLTASDGAGADLFGTAVAISSNSAIVGATGDDDNGSASGSAYVFRDLDTATGTITQNVKLTASDGAAGDGFGNAVSLSGDTAIVGAWEAEDVGNNSGAAYLFRGLDTASGNITESVKLTASNVTWDGHFGISVAIDGDQFVVSSEAEDSRRGRAYSGRVSSVTTLDDGNASRTISGLSFESRENWIIGENTDNNHVTLSADDTASVLSAGKAVFIGRNAGADNNTLSIGGILNATEIYVGAAGNSGNTLVIDGSVNAPVQVASGSAVSGSGTLNGLLTLGNGAHLTPGNSAGTLTLTSGLTLEAGSFLNFELGNPLGTAGVDSDLLLLTGGTLTGPSGGFVTINFADAGGVGLGTYDLIDGSAASLSSFDVSDFVLGDVVGGYDFSFGLSGGILQVTTSLSAVPEPSSFGLIAGAMMLGFAGARRRRRAASPVKD